MEKIQEFTQAQFDIKLKELHHELSRIKPAIDSLEKIASDSASILKYQSNTSEDFGSIVREFTSMAKTLPEAAKEGINFNLQIVENEVGFQVQNLSTIVKKQSNTLKESFTEINSLVQTINNISSSLADLDFESIVAREIYSLLDDLKKELGYKLDNIVKDLHGQSNHVIESQLNLIGQLNETNSAIKNQLKSIDELHGDIVQTELSKKLIDLGKAASKEEDILNQITLRQNEQSLKHPVLIEHLEGIKSFNEKLALEIQKSSNSVEDRINNNLGILNGLKEVNARDEYLFNEILVGQKEQQSKFPMMFEQFTNLKNANIQLVNNITELSKQIEIKDKNSLTILNDNKKMLRLNLILVIGLVLYFLIFALK